MRVSLVAAMSADGFIARHTTELADWTSKEDKRQFVAITKRAGVIIMGGTTYRTIGKALPGRRNIVYSHSQVNEPGIETTAEPPEELLERLAEEGCSEVAICGGQSIYAMFLEDRLVTDLYLTYEPVLFGRGISLSAHADTLQLSMKELTKLNGNTITIHYEVIR